MCRSDEAGIVGRVPGERSTYQRKRTRGARSSERARRHVSNDVVREHLGYRCARLVPGGRVVSTLTMRPCGESGESFSAAQCFQCAGSCNRVSACMFSIATRVRFSLLYPLGRSVAEIEWSWCAMLGPGCSRSVSLQPDHGFSHGVADGIGSAVFRLCA